MTERSNRFFVTGTDTSVGKSVFSALLLQALSAEGFSTAALKPVASGATYRNGKLQNDDALLLQAAASIPADYELINPLVFEPPVAPHIAAQSQCVELSVDACMQAIQPVLKGGADYLVVEGAGGWLVPLNGRESFADLATAVSSKVIMLVAVKLGCINHALLTAQAIRHSGATLVGWVANFIEPDAQNDPVARNIVDTLSGRIASPKLAELPYIAEIGREGVSAGEQLAAITRLDLARKIDLTPLLRC